MAPSLVWQPIHAALDDRARTGDVLYWVVAPFIKVDALKRLFLAATPGRDFKIVCRWRPSDLVSGASDLDVFQFLRDMGHQLYINPQIHMKLYAFKSNWALSSSANLTLRGLGYLGSEGSNIEVGSNVRLNVADWMNLYRVVEKSRLVTPDLFAKFKEYVASQPPSALADRGVDLLGPEKRFTLASLPATSSPTELTAYYLKLPELGSDPDLERRAFHDLVTFGIPLGLTPVELEGALRTAFCRNAFVIEFLAFLRAHGSLRFGAVNGWIHEQCEDVPLPYRWEVKSTTHAFYNWLAHFVYEVHWDRPNHSQVVYWRDV